MNSIYIGLAIGEAGVIMILAFLLFWALRARERDRKDASAERRDLYDRIQAGSLPMYAAVKERETEREQEQVVEPEEAPDSEEIGWTPEEMNEGLAAIDEGFAAHLGRRL